ncbi:efflux RND transporter periplasmic adaptor subunit [Neoroseomonas oryzicola]|uniref:Efflux RND transporter periplasmic adaptor subunit n=1 Tax=Neoroseomonas oryzicola TaxID=535904 RepID=A0A9X9WGA1_9PROT|nr:efflux RND transporter periplasmic adaptor subunit [Neoroseomonas oryzicola]MBR0659361.1 efflux RND transporter periplasmic adaptor subunit [Neoroseomonas oryzicola]NKE16262.1 efflux RND transporter periplasmic adaptor subunit [Neoroseomonas oryzicola]
MRRALPALALLAALPACRDGAGQAAAPEPPKPVQVAEIRFVPAEQPRAFAGVVKARREADIAFRAGGRVQARLVDVGTIVAAGQELARLDPADIALSVRAAEADLAAAEAEFRRAAADAARSRTLLAAGHVAAAYDDQRQATARTAEERVASARAGLDLARNRLGYTVLRAPTDGVVTALVAEVGQVVAEGQPVMRMADPAERELLVQVPEGALPGLAGAEAQAVLWARPGEPVAARLREVSPQADAMLRTYAVRFSLPAAPDWAALGMTGTIRLRAESEPVALLPASALHDRGQGPMVWKVQGERVVAVPVEVARLGETQVALRGALAEGDRIVALGPQLLDPGTTVRVVQNRPAATLR